MSSKKPGDLKDVIHQLLLSEAPMGEVVESFLAYRRSVRAQETQALKKAKAAYEVALRVSNENPGSDEAKKALSMAKGALQDIIVKGTSLQGYATPKILISPVKDKIPTDVQEDTNTNTAN